MSFLATVVAFDVFSGLFLSSVEFHWARVLPAGCCPLLVPFSGVWLVLLAEGARWVLSLLLESTLIDLVVDSDGQFHILKEIIWSV